MEYSCEHTFEKMAVVYILLCSNGSFYVGSTVNLDLRVKQHLAGIASVHTRKYRPVKLVFFETHLTIDQAFKRERQIKGWSRSKKLALIEGDIEQLIKLSNSNLGPSTC
ncbi:MAG: GIY-YIG nuclease family protein [Flavobacteriales bacterium]|nr:GIY-YIG nuclease family protein [Flavobacteriales bacterium]